jgi:hypothetical protein
MKIENDVIDTNLYYCDLPKGETLSSFKKTESQWLKQQTSESLLTKAFNNQQFIPIGVNDQWALGMVSARSTEHKQSQRSLENYQFAHYWICTLLRCRHKKQYEVLMGRFMKMVDLDQDLKPAANAVLRNEELIAHRNGLPEPGVSEGPSETPKGLDLSSFMIRPDAEHWVGFSHPIDLVDMEVSANHYIAQIVKNPIHKRNINKRVWKPEGHQLKILEDTFPATYMNQDTGRWVVAYYINATTIRVDSGDGNGSEAPVNYYIQSTQHGMLDCSMNSKGLIAVSDGYHAYVGSIISVHKLEKDLKISSITLSDDFLIIGSSLGHIFRISLIGSKVMTNVMIRDSIPIVNAHRVGKKTMTQSCNQVNLLESAVEAGEDLQIPIIQRVLSSCIRGTRIAVLTKGGYIQIFYPAFRGLKIEFAPPPNLQCQSHITMSWYKGGIWISPNGKSLMVLYMDGVVRKIEVLIKSKK